ncbi:hypothetical protein SOVF_018830 [Spinacia oleracea]|uniref:MYB-CC type transcription factor LHEQLE-containing domain-containing protein n=1 Tax=Spinacia oleracea TaxID=3562 RepID=A0A9R0JX40_SPIOL|nr:uncharacterized protein LOC110789918 [Spinacia oleracea]KNA24111.1 hypothetical protein SOVF_018830 [Spinacia oleracea]
MDNGKGKNKVDEYDQEQNYEDEYGICTLRQNPDIIGSSSSYNELPESGEKSVIAEPDEPLRQISTDLVLAAPCCQIQRSQRLSDEGSGRKRMRETGSSGQSQFHHQLESGSGVSGSYHLESPGTSNSSSSLPISNMDELQVQTKLHLQVEAEKHLQLRQDAERRYMAVMLERVCQQATQPGDNLIPPAPQLTTDFPSETYSPYLYTNNCAWHKQLNVREVEEDISHASSQTNMSGPPSLGNSTSVQTSLPELEPSEPSQGMGSQQFSHVRDSASISHQLSHSDLLTLMRNMANSASAQGLPYLPALEQSPWMGPHQLPHNSITASTRERPMPSLQPGGDQVVPFYPGLVMVTSSMSDQVIPFYPTSAGVNAPIFQSQPRYSSTNQYALVSSPWLESHIRNAASCSQSPNPYQLRSGSGRQAQQGPPAGFNLSSSAPQLTTQTITTFCRHTLQGPPPGFNHSLSAPQIRTETIRTIYRQVHRGPPPGFNHPPSAPQLTNAARPLQLRLHNFLTEWQLIWNDMNRERHDTLGSGVNNSQNLQSMIAPLKSEVADLRNQIFKLEAELNEAENQESRDPDNAEEP